MFITLYYAYKKKLCFITDLGLCFLGWMCILDGDWRCWSLLGESHGPLTEVQAAMETLAAQCLFDAFGGLQRASAWLL